MYISIIDDARVEDEHNVGNVAHEDSIYHFPDAMHVRLEKNSHCIDYLFHIDLFCHFFYKNLLIL